MNHEQAECAGLPELLRQMGQYLDKYQRFEHPDAMEQAPLWRELLQRPLPEQGAGMETVMRELGETIIPNGSQIPKPSCTAFITTGATSAGVISTLAGSVASPQRAGLTAFNFLEELSLQWLAQLFELPPHMKGLYSSGGSVANLVALGGARQWAFEQIGQDPARDGVSRHGRIYASAATHHTIQRAAAVLGLGRRCVCVIDHDSEGRMSPDALRLQLEQDVNQNILPIAVIANAGSTSTGVIDPLKALGDIASQNNVWFHVDGAYGLPGILDPQVKDQYQGLELADSVIVDPHKWLGAPVGIGATFVKDRSLLHRAFTQEASDYLEGSLADNSAENSMDSLGIPYFDFGVELSAPSRGAVVWALIREIGKSGLSQRVIRHNRMARYIAEEAKSHPRLELLQDPTLSICCFRYFTEQHHDLNELNRRIHRSMVHAGNNIPSTAMVTGKLAIRPCFVGARTSWNHAEALVREVIETGDRLCGLSTETYSK